MTLDRFFFCQVYNDLILIFETCSTSNKMIEEPKFKILDLESTFFFIYIKFRYALVLFCLDG